MTSQRKRVTPNDFEQVSLQERRREAWRTKRFRTLLKLYCITIFTFIFNAECCFAGSHIYDDKVREFKRRIRFYGKSAAKQIRKDNPAYTGVLCRALWELWFEGTDVPGDTPLTWPLDKELCNFCQLGFDLGWHTRLTNRT